MRKFLILAFAWTVLVTFAGCIISDDTTTFYIFPDGKVHMVMFKDNIRSTETGAKKTEEEGRWLAEYKGQKLSAIKKFSETGAKNIRPTLLKEKAPYSLVVTAEYDTPGQFGSYFDFNAPGNPNTLEWKKEKNSRQLLLRLAGDPSQKNKKASPACADGCPVFRFVVEQGKITTAKGFFVAKDARSCVLDFESLHRLSRTQKTFDLSIAWNVP